MGDGATSRRHHPNPAEAEWRWRGGGARRAGVKSAEPWVSRSAKTPHCFVPCSTKIVSQNQPLETAASKPVESPKSVSGDWLPTPEIARNRANSPGGGFRAFEAVAHRYVIEAADPPQRNRRVFVGRLV